MKNIMENITVMCDKVMSPRSSKVFEQIGPDSLNGLGEFQEEKFYKLTDCVFAEPLKKLKDQDQVIENDIKLFDKVAVENKNGKRKKYHIPLEDISKLICPEKNCMKKFSSVTLLRGHVRKIHCVEHHYICENCGKRFTAKYLLLRHKMVHENKVVECPVCCKKLSGRTNLSVHIKSHTNTRQHKCETCSKTFVRKCTLDVHIKFVHNKELHCGKCGERFEKRGLLTRHMSSHKT